MRPSTFDSSLFSLDEAGRSGFSLIFHKALHLCSYMLARDTRFVIIITWLYGILTLFLKTSLLLKLSLDHYTDSLTDIVS